MSARFLFSARLPPLRPPARPDSIFLASTAERNETLFYRLVVDNIFEYAPFIYTPTVGHACLQFGNIWRASRGLYLNLDTAKGEIENVLENWPADQVEIIVVTDGSRILGLGDLGVNGQGIPIGKLALYVAAAGFHPSRTMPVLLDVGTNNKELREQDDYLGIPRERCDDDQFYGFVDEFMTAVKRKWPHCLVQFEDFSNNHVRPGPWLLGSTRWVVLLFVPHLLVA